MIYAKQIYELRYNLPFASWPHKLKTATIRLKISTKALLSDYGKKSETYEDVALRLHREVKTKKG
jgi:hypothetical protein